MRYLIFVCQNKSRIKHVWKVVLLFTSTLCVFLLKQRYFEVIILFTVRTCSECILFSFLPVNTSDILAIETETENRFVLEKLWSLGFVQQSVWLGMFFNIDSKYYDRTTHSCHLHMTAVIIQRLLLFSADSLTWVDGTPVQYTSWPSKPPDPRELSTDTCVSTKASDGVWYLTHCREKLGFVCKTVTRKFMPKRQ